MRRTNVTLPQDLVDSLLETTGAKNKTKAVLEAIEDYLQKKRQGEVKRLFGKGGLELSFDELRHREPRE